MIPRDFPPSARSITADVSRRRILGRKVVRVVRGHGDGSSRRPRGDNRGSDKRETRSLVTKNFAGSRAIQRGIRILSFSRSLLVPAIMRLSLAVACAIALLLFLSMSTSARMLTGTEVTQAEDKRFVRFETRHVIEKSSIINVPVLCPAGKVNVGNRCRSLF